jgi:hypothetical protein
MMSAPLDELYLQWLYMQVADPEFKDKQHTFWRIFRILYSTPFEYDIVPMDENRAEDGKELRLRFFDDHEELNVDPDWIELPCSVLEMMVGLSFRLKFDEDGGAHYWFWTLMQNIGLSKYNDQRRLDRARVRNILEVLIYRQYDSNGRGGLFPLRNPREDQREIELLAQMSAYILEQG